MCTRQWLVILLCFHRKYTHLFFQILPSPGSSNFLCVPSSQLVTSSYYLENGDPQRGKPALPPIFPPDLSHQCLSGVSSRTCSGLYPSHDPLSLLHQLFLLSLVSPLVWNYMLGLPTFKERSYVSPLPSLHTLHHFWAMFHSKTSGTSMFKSGLCTPHLFKSSWCMTPLKLLLGLFYTCTGRAERVWRRTRIPAVWLHFWFVITDY